MEYMNLQLNDQVLTLGYNHIDCAYVFEQDIEFDDWIISKIIRQGGPKYSRYQYDFNNYFEFVISDRNGISRIERYFYNKGNSGVLAYWTDNPPEVIAHYIKSSLIFQTKDWEDYDDHKILAQIKRIMDQNIAPREQLKQIKQLLNIA